MPPIRGQRERRWSTFELQTLLALMAKGAHLEGQSKKKDDPSAARRNAHLNFATELNKALHGNDFRQDIPRKEVTRMLEKVLAERKHIVGRGGLMERQTMNRLTRSLRLAWETNRKINFDGSIAEWKGGRKLEEINKERATKGLAPLVAQDIEEEEMWAAATAQRCLLKEQGLVPSTTTSSPSHLAGGIQGDLDKQHSLVEPPTRSSYRDNGYSQPSMNQSLDTAYSPFSAQDYIHQSRNIEFSLSQEGSTANNTQHSKGVDYNGDHSASKLPAMLSPLKSQPNSGPVKDLDKDRANGGNPRVNAAANAGRTGVENVDMDTRTGSDADGEFEWENGGTC